MVLADARRDMEANITSPPCPVSEATFVKQRERKARSAKASQLEIQSSGRGEGKVEFPEQETGKDPTFP